MRSVSVHVSRTMYTIIPFSTIDLLSQTLAVHDQKSAPYIVELLSVHTITRDFTVHADLTDDEIIQFMRANAEKFFGCIAEQLGMDYQSTKTPDGSQQTIQAFATHQSVIADIQQLFLQKKIPLHAVRPEHVSNINLLPWRQQRQDKQRQNMLLRLIIYAILFCLTMLFVKSYLNKQSDVLSSQLVLIKNQARHIVLKNIIAHQQLWKTINKLFVEKKESMVSNDAMGTALLAIANALPTHMVLLSLTATAQKIVITGEGNSLSAIHRYHAKLQQGMHWKHAVLSDIRVDPSNSKNMRFTLQIIV